MERSLLKSGTDRDELIQVLRDLDENTRMDSVLAHPSDSVSVTVHPQNGDFQWRAELNRDDRSPQVLQTGKTFPGLKKALEELHADVAFDDKFVVLVHIESETTRTFDGKYKTTWAKISPSLPYEIQGNTLKLEIVSLLLTEAELSLCSELELAFYDEFDEVLYPITSLASDSLGRLMDCQTAFKNRSRFPLGPALLLADKLADAKGISFITRRGTKKVRPLIGVAGTRYQMYPQAELVEQALDLVAQSVSEYGETIWPFEVERWKVCEDRTITDISLGTRRDLYRILLTVQTGDVPGSSIQVSVHAVFTGQAEQKDEEARILLCRNTSYHWKSFQKQGGMSALFRGVFESVRCFDEEIESLSHIPAENCAFTTVPVQIRKAVGKRKEERLNERFAEAISSKENLSAADLISRVLLAAWIPRGGEKQEGELEDALSLFFNQFCGRSVAQAKGEKKDSIAV